MKSKFRLGMKVKDVSNTVDRGKYGVIIGRINWIKIATREQPNWVVIFVGEQGNKFKSDDDLERSK